MKFNFSTRFSKILGCQLSLPDILLYAALIVTSYFNLRFRRSIPTNAGANAPHDDLLGIRLTQNILQNNWLGDWNNLTLAKPPGYSLYLAVVNLFPFQLVVVNQLLYCTISLLFVAKLYSFFLHKVKYGRIVVFFIYTYLIFNPFLFGSEMSRAYRTSTHSILVLLYCTIFFSLLNVVISLDLSSKNKSYRKILAGKVVCLSLVYTSLILLRSESYWILISSLLVFAAVVFRKTRKYWKNKRAVYSLLSGSLTLLCLGFSTYLLPISIIGSLNNVKYGSSLVENYSSGNFANAIKDWQRVIAGDEIRPYVIVSKDQREAVYRVSRNAALLKSSLELAPGQGWQSQSCNAPIRLCDNSGPWFTWQVRDAAISTGLVKNEIEFQEFFKQISTDINVACQNKSLQCGQLGMGVGVKPLRELPELQILQFARDNFLTSLPFNLDKSGSIATPDQYGASPEVISEFHKVVKYRVYPQNANKDVNVSEALMFLQKVYWLTQWAFFILASLGFILAWRLKNWELIYGSLLFSIMSLALNSIGVAIAQVSFGWRVEGPYLLAMQPLFQFYLVLGLVSLLGGRELRVEHRSIRD